MSKDYEEFMEKSIAKSADLVNEEIQVSIDISMYPNKEDFIPPIKGFIKKINTYKNLKITTFPTSTVVQGEYEYTCLLYTSPSPRDRTRSRMPSSA